MEQYIDFSQREHFKFYRMPKALFEDRRYAWLSPDAKLLYTLLLDRVSLSASNGKRDARGVYAIYTAVEVQRRLGYGRGKTGRLFAELEKSGLITRLTERQGLPPKIYLTRFDDGGKLAETGGMSVENSQKSVESLPQDASKSSVQCFNTGHGGCSETEQK